LLHHYTAYLSKLNEVIAGFTMNIRTFTGRLHTTPYASILFTIHGCSIWTPDQSQVEIFAIYPPCI